MRVFKPSLLAIFFSLSQDVWGLPSESLNDSFLKCQAACGFLFILLKGKVSYPQSPIYQNETKHWSQQQSDVRSVCRVSPTQAKDVSTALLSLKTLNCPFAVKSGGHAAFKGASNIEGGITIDFVNLNQITLSADKSQASIGPGNRWSDVYTYLDAIGVSVVGGRVADIGVGGLTLGGGISYFSGRFGFACDNVNNYEVVFADGTIRNVNLKTYPDLFWALRGGGNNFGIVTRFDLKAFPQGQLWGGPNYYTIDKSDALLTALANLAINAPSDPFASIYLAYGYDQASATFLVIAQLLYGKPIANPPIFKNFTDIPSLFGNTKVASLSEFTQDILSPDGFRQTYWTATIKSDAALMSRIQAIFAEEVEPLKSIAGFLPALVFQPISKNIISQFGKNGGNALGITSEDGPLIVFNTAIQWSNTADDVKVLAAARNTINRATAEAKTRGLDFRFIYQNYASAEQNVFDGYGKANREKLKKISKKYDPSSVFQNLQPGYFKL